ncbi:MAG: LemA family protein [Candidatus Aenigmatarchaeota archaeon]
MAEAKQNFISKYKWPLIAGVIVLLLAGWIAGMYNNFVRMDQDVSAKWSEVENQYQRQADLIPNLISTVSSAVKVETSYVTAVTEARSRWQTAGTAYDKDTAGIQMNNAVTALMNAVLTHENYPVLQANQQYAMLMDELTGTQNRIATARGRYISSIQSYNTGIRMFPANVFAGMFGFTEKAYYQATTELITPAIGAGALP